MHKILFCIIIIVNLALGRGTIVDHTKSEDRSRPVRPEKDTYSISPSGHFYIHYDITGNAAPDLTDLDSNNIPDYIDNVAAIADSAHHVLVDIMQYEQEPFDGDGGYDIYVMSSNPGVYGITNFDSNGSYYLEIDNDYLGYSSEFDVSPQKLMQLVVAHHYFYAIQFGYRDYNPNDRYLNYMSSMWFEEVIVPDANDYLDGWVDPLLNNPTGDFNNLGQGYELALFGHYLSSFLDEKGVLDAKNSTIMREIWESYSENNFSAFEAIKDVLENNYGITFNKAWTDFISRNIYNGMYTDMNNPFYYYSDQALIDPIDTNPMDLSDSDSSLYFNDLNNYSVQIKSFNINNSPSLIIEGFSGTVEYFGIISVDSDDILYNDMFIAEEVEYDLFSGSNIHFVFSSEDADLGSTLKISISPFISGCTDPGASNYNPDADISDQSCIYDSYQDFSEYHWSFSNWINDYYKWNEYVEGDSSWNEIRNQFLIPDCPDEINSSDCYSDIWERSQNINIIWNGTIISTTDEEFIEIFMQLCGNEISTFTQGGYCNNNIEVIEQIAYENNLEVVKDHEFFDSIGKYNYLVSGWDDNEIAYVVNYNYSTDIMTPNKQIYRSLFSEDNDNSDCILDCPGLEGVFNYDDPSQGPNDGSDFCNWILSLEDGSECLDDCDNEILFDLQLYSFACDSCLEVDICDELFLISGENTDCDECGIDFDFDFLDSLEDSRPEVVCFEATDIWNNEAECLVSDCSSLAFHIAYVSGFCGDCGYGGDCSMFGCTDPNADNYNPDSMIDIDNCEYSNDAISSQIIIFDNEVYVYADGYVGGVQMTLTHGDDFYLDITEDALIADYNTSDSTTILIVIAPESGKLFDYIGDFTIVDLIVTDSQNYISSEVVYFQNGDVNYDTVINVLDVVSIVNYIVGNIEPNMFESLAADYNSDGILDVLDAVLIVNIIMNNG